jgi:putative CocE/NonD family hydrolase
VTLIQELPNDLRVDENVWITMFDGCRLAARIWRPDSSDQHAVPAILEYLPYRKRDGTAARDALTHPYFAGHGYACIRVDMRGSGESDGLMWDEYLAQEQDDALEVIDWLCAQPWCDANVGMIGISWGGLNGLQVACRQPMALKAVVTLCFTDDRYADDIHYKGGCLLNENVGWSSTMLAYSSRPPDPDLVGERWREMWLERLGNEPLLVSNWLRHPHRDDYWRHGSICEDPDRITAAVLAVGGWGDAYSNAVPRLLARLKAPCRGIVGPWLHKYPHFAVPGPAIGFLQEALRWWDHWLKGIETGVMNEPAYRAYIQESVPPRSFYEWRDGRWVTEPSWPSENIKGHMLQLGEHELTGGTGSASTLTICSPQSTGAMGGEYCAIWLGPEAPGDQRADDAGSLCFDTAPLRERMEILGPPVVELAVSVDRPVAHLAVRLCDVAPGGASTRITYGVLNLCHRNSHAHPEPLEPGEVYRIRVQLDDIGYAIPPGHRIRLSISTAYWPLIWPAPEPVTATLFTADSRLILPERPPRENDGCAFEAPENTPPLRQQNLRAASNERTVTIDATTGRSVTRIVDDFGKNRNLEHGLTTGSTARESYSILPDEPLSAEVETHWTEEPEREDWVARTETFTRMTADADAFHLTARLEAYEGEVLIFSKDYQDTIPRDLL